MVHSRDILVSLYPIPNKLNEYLKNTHKTYKSSPVEVHLNSSDFGLKRSDLIDDYNAKLLYPELEKFGFSLPKERITNMSRSKGDLSVIKNDKRILVEITNLAQEIPAIGKYQRDHAYRDKLIGKMIRLNEDFKRIIEKYRINIIFTDFEKDWQISVARKINDLVEVM